MPDADGNLTTNSALAQMAMTEEAAAPSAPGQPGQPGQPGHVPTGAAAGMDGVVPTAERPQKRVALPQHALLATQLQVCPRASKANCPHHD